MSVITFMIGNGFDLACGLKSKYSDSYDGYIKSPSDSAVIEHFKSTMEKNIGTWADFEMKIIEYARSLEFESELIECLRDYTTYLNRYLLQEQQIFQSSIEGDGNKKTTLINEMRKLLFYFYYYQTPNDQRAISSAINDGDSISLQFISFNYTNAFDEIAKAMFSVEMKNKDTRMHLYPKPIIHIHGKLGRDVVLGVDNESQLQSIPYNISNRGMRKIVKPVFLEDYDEKRKADALSYIMTSNVICVFGLALGESDHSWKKALADWLLNDNTHHLVFYDHSIAKKTYIETDVTQRMDDEEEGKEKLMNMLYENIVLLDNSIYKQVFNQIHIPTNVNLFHI